MRESRPPSRLIRKYRSFRRAPEAPPARAVAGRLRAGRQAVDRHGAFAPPKPARMRARRRAGGEKGRFGWSSALVRGNWPGRDQFSSASHVRPGQAYSPPAPGTPPRRRGWFRNVFGSREMAYSTRVASSMRSSSGRRRPPSARPGRPPAAPGPRRCRRRRPGTPPTGSANRSCPFGTDGASAAGTSDGGSATRM